MSRSAALVILTTIVAGTAPLTADAASQTSRVKKAVRAEVRDRYAGFNVTDVSCSKLTAKRYKCAYTGLYPSKADGPCRGTARATAYARNVDVTSLSRYRCDF